MGAEAMAEPASPSSSGGGSPRHRHRTHSDMERKLPHQHAVAVFYNGNSVQIVVAFIIGANFLTNIVEKEIDPKGDRYKHAFAIFNIVYNVLFTLELAINIYAHWWCEFWRSSWNIFDVIVVTIGLINMMELPLPSAFSMLRMMRAFRVFRLFKRVHSLNKIIVAIVHAIPGVANAFLILGIVMSIYAILAVEFYTTMADDCFDVPDDHAHAKWRTPRGKCAGPEYFGTFSRSLYTFFQVLTGESWSEMVARPAIWFYYDQPIKALGGSFFFVTYVLVTAFMLINVVVAVLLDKITDPNVAEEATHHDDESEAGDESEDAKAVETNGESEVTNGAAIAVIADTGSARLNQLQSVQLKVGQLVEERQRIRADLDAYCSDVADLKQKLAVAIQLVSSGNSS